MSERTLDGTVKIYETPGARRIRYLFKVPDDLDEPYADLYILTDGGCNTPDIRRLKVEIKANGDWEDITDDCTMDPENGSDSTTYKIVFPELVESGTRLRITILFDDEFESGEYIVFRPSFDDGSVLGAVHTVAPSTGELALAIFKRQARTLVASEMIASRGSAVINDRTLSALVRRWGIKGTLERLASVSPEFQELLLSLDALEQHKGATSSKSSKKRGKSKGGRR